jgi:ABC-type transport system involved in cytochrome bd biosynthesis fused ATPase/permease subunit
MLTKTGAPRAEPPDFEIRTSAAEPGGGSEGAAVTIRGVGHSFGQTRALAGFEATAAPGVVLGSVGPSGCGKSTRLELVAGLSEPGEGMAGSMAMVCTYPRHLQAFQFWWKWKRLVFLRKKP